MSVRGGISDAATVRIRRSQPGSCPRVQRNSWPASWTGAAARGATGTPHSRSHRGAAAPHQSGAGVEAFTWQETRQALSPFEQEHPGCSSPTCGDDLRPAHALKLKRNRNLPVAMVRRATEHLHGLLPTSEKPGGSASLGTSRPGVATQLVPEVIPGCFHSPAPMSFRCSHARPGGPLG
jgi:hypothetical protein